VSRAETEYYAWRARSLCEWVKMDQLLTEKIQGI
jgi:hypothetical protein